MTLFKPNEQSSPKQKKPSLVGYLVEQSFWGVLMILNCKFFYMIQVQHLWLSPMIEVYWFLVDHTC
jgi:hypothetical protein